MNRAETFTSPVVTIRSMVHLLPSRTGRLRERKRSVKRRRHPPRSASPKHKTPTPAPAAAKAAPIAAKATVAAAPPPIAEPAPGLSRQSRNLVADRHLAAEYAEIADASNDVLANASLPLERFAVGLHSTKALIEMQKPGEETAAGPGPAARASAWPACQRSRKRSANGPAATRW